MSSSPATADASIPPRAAHDSIRLLAYPLFFASGMAGLVYEIIWTRMLIYVFGAGIFAVTAVLVAFMAGLALGAAVFGPLSDRLKRPLLVYGVVELLIGAAGFVLPSILDRISVVDGWAYGLWGQNFAVLTAARFGVTFLLLLIPTTLMGATLPILSKAMIRDRSHIGMHVGELYGVNTIGAVAGTFLAGFFFIERFGVRSTASIAVALNLIAALGAFAISLSYKSAPFSVGEETEGEEAEGEEAGVESAEKADAGEAELPSDPGLSTEQVRLILAAVFITGVVSLAAQVLWFRSLVFSFRYLKSTTYAFSAMLTVFLIGLGFGSLFIGWVVDRYRNPMRLYGILLALLGVSIAFSVNMLYSGGNLVYSRLGDPVNLETQSMNWSLAVVIILLISAFVLGMPTLLMGMALPVAVRAVASVKRVGGYVGGLYALNTTGAIFGALGACFLIIPTIGLTWGIFFVAAVDAVLGLYLIARSASPKSYLYIMSPLTVVLFVAAFSILPAERSMFRLIEGETLHFYEEGPLATVSVVEGSFGYRVINVDTVGVAGTDPLLQTDQKSLAHYPMFLVEDPRDVLTVGFGSGGASYSYLLHDRVETVHCVEISREVVNAAPYLLDANHGLLTLNDPRYTIIFDDARTYLQYTDQTYDIITTDCTDLRYKSNANLYDYEYFQFCRAKLNPGGVVTLWMPLAGLSDEMFRLALRTFHRVFPEMAVFYQNNEAVHYILLIGWRDEMSIDFRRFVDRLDEPDVKADLAEIHLGDPIKLISTFVTAGEALEDFVAGEEMNTEDNPALEFKSPKYGYSDQPLLDNLASLMEIRASVTEWLVVGSMDELDRERLERYELAVPHIIEGHARYRNLQMEEATRAYMAALEITPEDKAVANLLTFEELVRGATIGSAWSWLQLGRTYQLQGKDDQAVSFFNRAKETIESRGGPSTDTDVMVLETAERWRGEIVAQRQSEDTTD